MINQERLVAGFIDMVRISSVSKNEALFAAYLKKKMEQIGLTVFEDNKAAVKASVKTGNLIGRLEGNDKSAPTLMFCAHMDTVEPGNGIEPKICEGFIRSNGTTILGADDKSGIAAILEAIICIKERNIAHGDLEIVFTFGEELGLLGAKYIDYSALRSRIGYVLDAGGTPGVIINRGPAQNHIRAIFRGKAAHAGICPEKGINAIQVAARAIENMQLLRVDEDTTANFGIISGGKATNIVCDEVFLDGEARSLSELKLELQTQKMIEAMQKACKDFGAILELEIERAYPSFYVRENEEVVQLARKAAEKVGLNVQISSTGGGSDVHFFNQAGIVTINLATGMNKVHTTEEEISIDDLIYLASFVEAIIEEASPKKELG